MPRRFGPSTAVPLRQSGGRLGSARSKTGDPACSQAMSLWVRGRKGGVVSAAVHAMLGKCRAMARMRNQAKSHEAAGNALKAQTLNTRADRQWTNKARVERAAALHAKRQATRSDPAQASRKTEPRSSPVFTNHRFGLSNAKVDFEGDTLRTAKQMLGPNITAKHVASLTGLPHDAQVNVRHDAHNNLVLTSRHPALLHPQIRFIKKGPDGVEIHNEKFAIKTEHQGEQFGLKALGRQVETAHALGVKRITADAWRERTDRDEHGKEKWSGYYVWPAYGADGPIPHRLRSALPPAHKNATRIREVMATPEGRDWWSKKGETAKVAFDLTPGSYSLRKLDDYLNHKLPPLQ